MIHGKVQMTCSEKTRVHLIICIALSALVLFSYRGVLENDFVVFDDPMYVTENLHLQRGLSGETAIWALTTTHTGNWHPLTWLSLMLDWEWFRMNAAGYHWTSVILHLLAGLLLFLSLNRMTASPWPSSLVAALFLIHPLHVESVAWVSERKDVLSGLFWMTGLWCYAWYAEKSSPARYLCVFLSFVACLMSKPMGVTFPFVLLLLDGWPLRRAQNGKSAWLRLTVEKIPFFLLSAASSVITFLIQKEHQAMTPLTIMSLSDRVTNAVVSYANYLGKAFWPQGLSFFYPYAGPPPFACWTSAVALLILVTMISIYLHRSMPYLMFGWFWYLGTLVPVIGLVQVGSQEMADRYTYLPLIGVFVMLVWGGRGLMNRFRVKKVFGGMVSISVLAALIVLTQIQVDYWKDSTTLINHALRNTERNYVAHELLAHHMAGQGDFIDAEKHFREAIWIRPNFKNALNGLGYLMMIQGKQDEAGRLLEKTLQVDPDFVPAIKNLGDVRMRQKRLDDAIQLYRRAMTHYKDHQDPELLNNYGVALFLKGDKEEAVLKIREALRLKPDYSHARENLLKIFRDDPNLNLVDPAAPKPN